jgi:hypothetical protein
MDMLIRMESGRFKVFAHLNDWWEEFRLYHRGTARCSRRTMTCSRPLAMP